MIKVFEGSREAMEELARKEKHNIVNAYAEGKLSAKQFLVKLGQLRKITYKFGLNGLFERSR